MDVVKTYLANFDALSDGCKQLYDIVIDKISQRYVYLPVTGFVLFYLVFVREISGKKRKRVDKKPCNPDEEYTGDERPNDYPVRAQFYSSVSVKYMIHEKDLSSLNHA